MQSSGSSASSKVARSGKKFLDPAALSYYIIAVNHRGAPAPPPQRRHEMATRFQKLVRKLRRRKGVTDPEALAAAIGRKKYGKKRFQQMAAAGRKRKAAKKRRRK